MKCIIGFTSKRVCMMDFDNTPLEKVVLLATKAMKKFKLEGFMVIKSSNNNYHVVFNKTMKYSNCIRVMAWIALQLNTLEAYKYLSLQIIKKASTLRISNKLDKPKPKPIILQGKHDKGIRIYLEARKMINEILEKVKNEDEAGEANESNA